MTAPALFGTLRSGEAVHRLRLCAPGGIEAHILTYGATVQSLSVPGPDGPVPTLIGFDDLARYEADRTYQAAIIGRTVNRMAGARFAHEGREWRVTANEGRNHLHGGTRGLTRQVWQADARHSDEAPVVLRHISPAGSEGYPGTLSVCVTFSLPSPLTLEIRYEAQVDAVCPVDLTHHLYFNLGQVELGTHRLGVSGHEVLEVDAAYLATGTRLSVDGTPFDLRQPQALSDVLARSHPQLTAIGLNQCWVSDPATGPMATVSAPQSGLRMTLYSNQPCLQVYSGLSREIAPFGALALEPQGYIDAVNQPGFPSPWLHPGETYQRVTHYVFDNETPL